MLTNWFLKFYLIHISCLRVCLNYEKEEIQNQFEAQIGNHIENSDNNESFD